MASRLRRDWVEMTTKDFQLTDMSKVIAVLPVAAIEQPSRLIPASAIRWSTTRKVSADRCGPCMTSVSPAGMR